MTLKLNYRMDYKIRAFVCPLESTSTKIIFDVWLMKPWPILLFKDAKDDWPLFFAVYTDLCNSGTFITLTCLCNMQRFFKALPRLGKRELICLLLFTCNYVVSVWRGFLFLWVLGMGYVILLWHSLSLPYNYFLK